MLIAILTTTALLVSSLAAALVLTGPDPVWVGGAGAMLAAGHLLLTAITIVGALVGVARWSVGLGIGLVSILAIPAVAHPITPAWGVMVGAAGLGLAGLVGSGLRGAVRHRPPADAPPRKAAGLVLGMLAVPVLIGALQPGGVDGWDWAVAGGTVALGVWYSRARPTALWASRFGLPALAVGVAFVIDFPSWVPAVGAYLALTWLAWSADVRIAVIPLASPGRSVPIPAELAPSDILDAAGLDSRGRHKGTP